MKGKLIGLCLVLSFFCGTTFATEYIYRDLMANTLPSGKCEAKPEAMKRAAKTYKLKRYSKKFCQTQGYGWHIKEIKKNGEVVCNDCSGTDALQQCYLKDVVVACKRIKPGTVGMLPGKG